MDFEAQLGHKVEARGYYQKGCSQIDLFLFVLFNSKVLFNPFELTPPINMLGSRSTGRRCDCAAQVAYDVMNEIVKIITVGENKTSEPYLGFDRLVVIRARQFKWIIKQV